MLASGNGRCNIHNSNLSLEGYQSSTIDKECLSKVFNRFGYIDFVKYLNKIGLFLEEKGDGKIYPISNTSKSVLEIFNRLINLSYVRCNEEIISIRKIDDRFILKSDIGVYDFDVVIMSCGSKANHGLGGSDSGYNLAKELKLNVVDIYPSLTPLKCEKIFDVLSGIKIFSKITIKDKEKEIYSLSGDLLFTNYGVSGFGILDISCYLHLCQEPILIIDFVPQVTREELESNLIRISKIYSNASLADVLSGYINPKLARFLSEGLNCNIKDIKKLVYIIKNFHLKPYLSQDFLQAEVCGGGVDFKEIKTETFETKKYTNLYIIGELLDIVGKRGGYNLAFAWASAYICANSIKSKFGNTIKNKL